jgi:hypothetical protein
VKVTDFFDLLWESFGVPAMDGTDNTGEPNEVWDSVVVTAGGSAGGGFTGETGFEWITPKSGDITRCVNVVDNLGFPPVRLDNQQRFVDMTMI